jgi:hypothetical protein
MADVDKATLVSVRIPVPRRVKRDPGESDILRRIREEFGKLPYVTMWRNNTGMLEDRNGTKVRFGLCEGSADLVGIVTMPSGVGRFFALEVKQPGKVPTAKQFAFLAHVNKMGGYGCWADAVEVAVDHVEDARAYASPEGDTLTAFCDKLDSYREVVARFNAKGAK